VHYCPPVCLTVSAFLVFDVLCFHRASLCYMVYVYTHCDMGQAAWSKLDDDDDDDDEVYGRNVGRRMVVERSNCSRTAVESQSSRGRIIAVTTHRHGYECTFCVPYTSLVFSDEDFRLSFNRHILWSNYPTLGLIPEPPKGDLWRLLKRNIFYTPDSLPVPRRWRNDLRSQFCDVNAIRRYFCTC